MKSLNAIKASMLVMMLIGTGISLSACAGQQSSFLTLSAAGQSFPRAEYQIKGRTAYDQRWIDKTVEAEVVGFGFKPPEKRPPGLDVAPKQQTVVEIPAQPATLTEPAKPAMVTVEKKPSLWQKIRHPIKTYKSRKKKAAPTS